jgi:hypothetical protein
LRKARIRWISCSTIVGANRQAVPAVDRDDRDRERDDLLWDEDLGHPVVVGVGSARLRQERQRFAPGERRLLTRRVARGFAPAREQVEPLLLLAPRPGVLRMHVEAVGAAVELRRSHADEL